jgi:hypothetical protein
VLDAGRPGTGPPRSQGGPQRLPVGVDGLVDGRAGLRRDVFVRERDEGDAQVDGVLERLSPGRALTLGTPLS